MDIIDDERQRKKSAYDIIGVQANASEKEIRLAFIKLAKTHHPDINNSDPIAKDKFIEIVKAYEILKNDAQISSQGSRVDPDFFREPATDTHGPFINIRRNRRSSRIFREWLIATAIFLSVLAILVIAIWANTKTDWIPNCC